MINNTAKRSVHQIQDMIQVAAAWDFYATVTQESIYCPMCESRHGNDTLCQLNWDSSFDVTGGDVL